MLILVIILQFPYGVISSTIRAAPLERLGSPDRNLLGEREVHGAFVGGGGLI